MSQFMQWLYSSVNNIIQSVNNPKYVVHLISDNCLSTVCITVSTMYL